MLTEKFPIYAEGTLSATLCTYIQDKGKNMMMDRRPLILMCPGGGYNSTTDREAEPIAVRFLAQGFHVAILRYSCKPAVFPTALLELAKSMELIHQYAEEWRVEEDKIFLFGGSAGGHLAACLGCFWHTDWLSEKSGVKNELLKPAGMLLAYPVISSGLNAHQGSFINLMAGQESDELRNLLSLDQQVTEHTPEAFIWATAEDASVPVENSFLFAMALHKQNIPVEMHIYPHGIHGLATADKFSQFADGRGIQDECTSWIPLAARWLKDRAW